MLEALVEKKLSAAEIAELAHGRLRQKMPQIAEALEGHRMTDHHRFLIGQCLKHMQYIDEMIGDLDKQIQEKLRSYSKQVQLACTVPGNSTGCGREHFSGDWNGYESRRTLSGLSPSGIVGGNMSW